MATRLPEVRALARGTPRPCRPRRAAASRRYGPNAARDRRASRGSRSARGDGAEVAVEQRAAARVLLEQRAAPRRRAPGHRCSAPRGSARRCAGGSSAASWNSACTRSQRARVHRRAAQVRGQPPRSSRASQAFAARQSRSTVASDTSSSCGGLGHIQSAEEAALDHQRLARVRCARASSSAASSASSSSRAGAARPASAPRRTSRRPLRRRACRRGAGAPPRPAPGAWRARRCA